MRIPYERVERLARDLDSADRRRLVEALRESLLAEQEPLHRVSPEEILARIRSLEDGTAEFFDADEVLAEAERRLPR